MEIRTNIQYVTDVLYFLGKWLSSFREKSVLQALVLNALTGKLSFCLKTVGLGLGSWITRIQMDEETFHIMRKR